MVTLNSIFYCVVGVAAAVVCPCCHSKVDWNRYVGRLYLESHGVNAHDFRLMLNMMELGRNASSSECYASIYEGVFLFDKVAVGYKLEGRCALDSCCTKSFLATCFTHVFSAIKQFITN